MIASDGSTLVVETTRDGSALLLSEPPSSEGTVTARERDVMRCVEEGLSNAEIARELWIQPTTVRRHLENIFASGGPQPNSGVVEDPCVEGQGELSPDRSPKDMTKVEWIPLPEATRLSSHTCE